MKTCLKTFALGVLVALASALHATPFLNSLAWSRYITTSQAKFIVDPSGNTYVVYQTPDATSGTNISYVRYDPAGNATASHFLFYRASNNVTVEKVFLTPGNAATTCLYVIAQELTATAHTGTVISKFDLAGNMVYQDNLNDPQSDDVFIGGLVDGSDNLRFALTINSAMYGPNLELAEWSPTGATILDKENNDIYGQQATFLNGKWSVVGLDTRVVAMNSSNRWGVYDPVTGNLLTGAVLDYLDNGTYSYSYQDPVQYVDPAGAVDIAFTVSAVRDSDHQVIGEKHFIRRYNLTGSLQWVSQSFDNTTQFLTSFGSNNNIYCNNVGGSPFNLEIFDHLGNRTFKSATYKAFSVYVPVCDATGVFEFFSDPANAEKIDILRFDTAGNNVWSTALVGSGGLSPVLTDEADINNNLYTCTILPNGTAHQAVIQRYVPGVTLSTLSTPNTLFAAGDPVPVRVQLNSPAPAGGIALKLTSSSAKALFPNNTIAYTLAIPAGSLYAIVNMHTTGVVGNTGVTVLGNQNGVQRAVGFTVTP
jgi:hypothetical protein